MHFVDRSLLVSRLNGGRTLTRRDRHQLDRRGSRRPTPAARATHASVVHQTASLGVDRLVGDRRRRRRAGGPVHPGDRRRRRVAAAALGRRAGPRAAAAAAAAPGRLEPAAVEACSVAVAQLADAGRARHEADGGPGGVREPRRRLVARRALFRRQLLADNLQYTTRDAVITRAQKLA